MKAIHLKRSAVLAGLIGAATLGAALIAPTAAMAGVGSQPGHLTLNPTSGGPNDVPSFSTDSPCPTGFQAGANLTVVDDQGLAEVISTSVPGANTALPGGFSGVAEGSMALIELSANLQTGKAYEFVINCHSDPVNGTLVQSTFVTFDANGNWTSTGTQPTGPVTTSTSVSAIPSTALSGANMTLNAAVTGQGAAGNVEFFDGTDSLGTQPVSNGTASLVVNTLAVGDHSITAKFEPTDPTAFSASTSSAVTVTIVAANGDTGIETLNVNVPLNEGVFTLTVNPGPVQLAEVGSTFEFTGQLAPVTVSDGRQQSHPGWSLSGQVSDFTSGSNSIDGDDLGWTPTITTQNAAADVVAGPAVAAGSHPGLKEGSGLASAAAGKGLGTSQIGAGLDLMIPNVTAPGSYSATLTITAVESAS